MLQVFKRNDISAYTALLFIALLCKMKYLLHPSLMITDTDAFDTFFFHINAWRTFLVNNPLFYTFLSITVQFIFALYVNHVLNVQKMHAQKNHFATLSFILVTSFFPQFNVLGSAFMANMFLFIAFSYVLKLSSTPQPRKWCFNVGLMLSIAVMFYFPVILFLPLFMLFFWIFRPFALQENVACILGFLTPVYLMLAVFYLQGRLPQAFASLNNHIQYPSKILQPIPVFIFIGICILLMLISVFVSNQNAFKNAILTRKKWRIVNVYLFFALIIALLSTQFPSSYFILALTPFSILLSQSFQNRKEKWNIFTFFFLMISVLSMQWVFLK